jgi:hypothetical protein
MVERPTPLSHSSIHSESCRSDHDGVARQGHDELADWRRPARTVAAARDVPTRVREGCDARGEAGKHDVAAMQLSSVPHDVIHPDRNAAGEVHSKAQQTGSGQANNAGGRQA